jgi:redox-sensing transcriptional repressor
VIFFTDRFDLEAAMKEIPAPSRRRLVLLERLLSTYSGEKITSQKIQELSGWTAAVIRRDISLLEIHCGASNGYKTEDLRKAIEERLNPADEEQKCCIVGLGKIGQTLLNGTALDGSPFKLVAGFDSNVNRTEILRSSFPLHPTTLLESVIEKEGIKYAILTVEKNEAPGIAERLAKCGVRGIVNYTPCILSVPATTEVENVCLLTVLETLAAKK